MTPEELIQKQLDAYNTCDIDGFCATCAKDILVRDGDGKVICKGVKEVRERYGPLFKDNPHQMAIIEQRLSGGIYVVDEEVVTGRADGVQRRALILYKVVNDLCTEMTIVKK
ncbi:MAG: nuclear transport factor 2 family protein [Planctomycetes bacterium]|nr:nuclear transport factor 2 family protein [Planctomycetota bacterium]